jgi:hypothetical protein
VLPFKFAALTAKAITGTAVSFDIGRLWWSRLIQVIFFLGIVYLTFKIVLRFADLNAARIVALLTATSAGLVIQTHFLTADVPVTFWMLSGFYAAQSIVFDPRPRTYVIAGLLVGVATATKYNGLAAGLAIPIFHWYANRQQSVLRALLDRRLIVGVAMVVGGFVAANPYSIFDYRRFAADFSYNYLVTPVYGGTDSYGFGTFLLAIPDIVGWPITVILGLSMVYSLWRLQNADLPERATLAAALGVFALYFLQFGRAPRVEIRFVVPIVAFLLVLFAALGSIAVRRYERATVAVVVALLAYNSLACVWVGKRFSEDPRMDAQAWVAANVPPHSTIESSQYTPHWNAFWGVDVVDMRMPSVSGRIGVLSHVFKADRSMMAQISERESDVGLEWYTAESLEARHPQYIALDSKYYDRFLNEDVAALDYPVVRDFLTALLANRLGYHRVYDRTAVSSPTWLYPGDIDFLDSQVIILRRDAG